MVTAMGTTKPFGPFHFEKVIVTGLFIKKPALKLDSLDGKSSSIITNSLTMGLLYENVSETIMAYASVTWGQNVRTIFIT